MWESPSTQYYFRFLIDVYVNKIWIIPITMRFSLCSTLSTDDYLNLKPESSIWRISWTNAIHHLQFITFASNPKTAKKKPQSTELLFFATKHLSPKLLEYFSNKTGIRIYYDHYQLRLNHLKCEKEKKFHKGTIDHFLL